MPETVIAAQMYTLREHLVKRPQMVESCRRVKQMGYDAIEATSFGPIEVADLAKLLRDEGLVCAGTHVSIEMMEEVESCLAYHETLNCTSMAIAGFAPNQATAGDWSDFARRYSKVARPFLARGMSVSYHAHSHELARYGDKTALDILIEKTNSAIGFEIDTYWITHGGGDPAAWIDKVSGRVPFVHFKDMAITLDRRQKMCEVGSGNQNWPRILESCRKAGVRWYVVERDDGDLDPFDSLQVSLENLHLMGLS